MNGNRWDAYSDQQRAWITEAVKEATAEERRVTYDQLDKSKAKVIADGGTVNAIDKTPLVAIAVPIQDELAKKLGLEDLLALIRGADK
jgi:YD repeat-containing protein